MDKFTESINVCQYLLTIIQTEQTLRVINLICSILGTAVILVFKILSWYKSAKKDGKITKEELDELEDIINEERLKQVKKEDFKNGK